MCMFLFLCVFVYVVCVLVCIWVFMFVIICARTQKYSDPSLYSENILHADFLTQSPITSFSVGARPTVFGLDCPALKGSRKAAGGMALPGARKGWSGRVVGRGGVVLN